ncbi:glycoside hydrolase family 3 C-terminal domain-containing protein [Mucilaginibacter sp. RS28]|uniref:Glycoside hydrolase family 3 C-terminal domain-containing protein n=1 Tax=Mucilaginibacter straminoryzae TaxID=2932774 RepID=A0A9X1X264_9SPHI|nr:glycoside hydrolase family 3 C-terminal domain-containing protein [Mucilaginibacter straminoryzae]MCJ8208985.1 glycoside hydrolase family 3 C-terminal domain-containing protein [Mucilaginibacter straminoryzae]
MASIRLRVTILGTALLCYGLQGIGQSKPPQLGKSPVADVIKAMTLEEKVQLLVGAGFNLSGATGTGTGVGQTQDRVPGAAGTTHAIPRLGIPSLVTSDGPAGVRIDSVRKNSPGKTYYATAWPVATLLASTWDTALVKKVGAAFGHEAKEYGIDIILAPALNIHRNPLGGRNFEYYSEDPLVAGRITAAMVNGIEANGVGTSIKHFAANNQETNRNTVNTIVSERALREIYLKGFEIAVKQSQPWTVMSSYNLINGTYTSESKDLLTTILRNEWGFKGFVMTDWFGGKDAVAQMQAGNNLLMPGVPAQSTQIIEAVKSGKLSEKVLDANVAGILNIILRSSSFKGYKYSDKPDLKKDAQIARTAATEGMVLLKNENSSLPVSKNLHNIALFGINGYELIAGGTGSGDVNKAYKVSLAQGLANAGYAIDGELQQKFTAHLADYASKHPKKNFFQEFMNPTPPAPEYALAKETILQKASATDLAVVAIGRNAGEGRDRKIEDDYELSNTEKELLRNVCDAYHAQHKKVIVVLNIGGVISVLPWRDQPDAILLAWQPGLEGGNAITDILTGKVNPSGKLATTFPAAYSDVPSAKSFPGKEFPEKATNGMLGMKSTPAEVTYEEGIYVGYRYYNTFHVKPAYEFGYGLSYTSFKYHDLKLSSTTFNGKITATVSITNTGKVAGKEAAQLYLSAPAKKLDKPAEELKGFAKTRLLKPGESQTLTFTLTPSELASFNTQASAWVADAGKYTVKVGASSADIKQTATFTLAKDLTVEKDHRVMVPQVQINELKK